MENLSNLLKYVRYWPAFLISIFVCISLAFAYIWYSPKQYKITSTLLIQNDIKGDGLFKGTAFSDLEMFKTATTVDNEIEVLRSRDLIFKVLKELNLEIGYFRNDGIKRTELYDKELPVKVFVTANTKEAYLKELLIKPLDAKRFVLQDDSKRHIYNFGQKITKPDYEIVVAKGPAYKVDTKSTIIKFNNLTRMAEFYSLTGLNIAPVAKEANTIVIKMLDAIPQRGLDIMARLIENYNVENVQNKNLTASNTISFIDSRLKNLSEDLRSTENNLENYKQKNSVTDISANAQMHLVNSGNYYQQLGDSEMQLNLINSIEYYVNQSDKNYSLVPSSLGLKDPTFNILTERYNSLQLERQRLLNNVRVDNPLIIDVNEQLANLRGSMQENVKNIKRGLLMERNNLRSKYNQFESKIYEVPAIERGLLEISREQNVKLGLYNYLLQKREETALSLTATIPTSKVIDKPAFSSKYAEPKDTLIYLLSGILGFLIPVGAIYSREKFSSKVRNVSDVRLINGARVLGELSNKGKEGNVVIQSDSRTTISELFRYIRTNLSYITNNSLGKSQVLLVTSGVQGEGKTFFSINLGLTLAMSGKKVVILEFDLRKPDLLKSMKLKAVPGITEYINTHETKLDDIIHSSGLSPNLSIIGCGAMPDNPAELLLNPKIHEFFYHLREKFDYIILDTSPVGLVADAFSLANYSDSSIYLVRYNFTSKFQLGILEDIYENNKLKNTLVVLNDAKEENRNSYGYGKNSYA